jgi:biopolymer transport protein ExbD
MLSRNIVFACLFFLMIASSAVAAGFVQATVPSQVWEQYYESDGMINSSIRRVVQTPDAGYAMATQDVRKYTPPVVSLIKTNSSGSLEWQKKFQMQGPYGFAQTTEGGYIIAGALVKTLPEDPQSVIGLGDVLLIQTDSEGNINWNKTLPYLGFQSAMIQSSDGGLLLAGDSDSRVWIVKTDANGNIQWNNTLPVSEELAASPILMETKNGEYAVAAGLELIKLDSSGRLLWNKAVSINTELEAKNVVQSSDDGFVFLAVNKQTSTSQTLKIDEKGDLQWNKTYSGLVNVITLDGAHGGPPFNVTFHGILDAGIQTSDGGYIFTGNMPDFTGYGKILVVKTAYNGEVEWNQTFGGIAQHNNGYLGKVVIQARDGSLIVGGSWSLTESVNSYYLTKINASLPPPSATPLPTTSSSWPSTYEVICIFAAAATLTAATGGALIIRGRKKKQSKFRVNQKSSLSSSVWALPC